MHIGTGKTGTTTIQRFLAHNRQALRTHGVLVPLVPGKTRHSGLYLYALGDDRAVTRTGAERLKRAGPDRFRCDFATSLAAEIAAADAGKVVLSDEGLSGLKPAEIVRLKALLEPLFSNIHVVIYLRRQDEHVVSRYLQTLARGNTATLEQHMAMDLSNTYDYHAKLRQWANHFQPASLRPRLFDGNEFRGGSLMADFLAAIDLADAGPFTDTPAQNASLDARRARFVRFINAAVLRGANRRVSAVRRKLVRYLAQSSTGARLALCDEAADDFMARWAASNAAVARDYFDRPDGVLFRTSR
ncbi:MAG: hypothetical protein HKN11_10215 [Rhizobiales bacterium]|nr:hypothetical protein [Hyphomicrobiales bacterium]